MKLNKRQLKRIIREEKTKLLRESSGIDDYEKLVGSRRSQHPMIAQAQANNHIGLMAQAVQACKDAGLSMEEIIALCEDEIMERGV